MSNSATCPFTLVLPADLLAVELGYLPRVATAPCAKVDAASFYYSYTSSMARCMTQHLATTTRQNGLHLSQRATRVEIEVFPLILGPGAI